MSEVIFYEDVFISSTPYWNSILSQYSMARGPNSKNIHFVIPLAQKHTVHILMFASYHTQQFYDLQLLHYLCAMDNYQQNFHPKLILEIHVL